MRRALRILSVTLITAGLVILTDAIVTLVWKEPLSAAYASFQQGAADDQLETAREEFLADPAVVDLGLTGDLEKQAKRLAKLYGKRTKTGEAFGRILVPGMDTDWVVLNGTDTATLQKGPGHYPTTALPGQGKTIGVAGHRTTYGAPFNQIDKVEIGDEVVLEMPYGTFTYEVSETRIVKPTDVEVVDDIGSERVVLTACHPLYSAAERYVVFAELEDLTLLPGFSGRWPAP